MDAVVDPAKARFLFADARRAEGVDDLEDVAALLEETFPVLSGNDHMALELVAGQIIKESPAGVWEVAQRLTALGLEPGNALSMIVLAYQHAVHTARRQGTDVDEGAYVESLATLPLPSPLDIEPVIVEVVREQPGIASEDIDFEVLERLGLDPANDLLADLVGKVAELATRDGGPLAWLGGDRTVVVADLMGGCVLTHRVSADECTQGVLESSDLAGHNRWGTLCLLLPRGHPAGETATIEVWEDRHGRPRWRGPEGWLAGVAPGTLLAVTVFDPGLARLEPVPEPAVDAGLLDRVRAAYRREVEGSDVPATLEEIALGLLLADPGTFGIPTLPLGELCRQAGLLQRGDLVAEDAASFRAQYRMEGLRRILDYFDKDDERMAVISALDAADSPDADVDLAAIARGARDPDVFRVLLDELVGAEDPAYLTLAERFTDRLQEAARQPDERAVALLLAAGVAERRGEVGLAESLVKRSLAADGGWEPALDRAGWYAFDRGDAAEAARCWRRMAEPDEVDLTVAQAFASARPGGPGRNDPCWCGSGRKYKVCHLGSRSLPPLPERFTWLGSKAATFLERRGVGADADLLRHAEARAGDGDADTLAVALQDPLVGDVTLVEGGWFARFLQERGPLLPDDEAELARAWVSIARTVYEVVAAEPGRSLTVRDLGGEDLTQVWDPELSAVLQEGWFVCGRVVPDGVGHRFFGRVFPVPAGREATVLALCAAGDSEALCRYVGSMPGG